MVPLLAVRELTRSFGGVTAVAGVTLELSGGGIHAVIGPNGAGKTTLFNLLSGIYAPDHGEILWDGQPVTGWPPHRMAQQGLSRTFQTPQVFPGLTVLGNVMVGAHRHGRQGLWSTLLRLPALGREERDLRRRALDALGLCGLEALAEREADTLPYGLLKRLEVARALAGAPRLLLMDEPAAGLNDTETAAMADLIRAIGAAGITVLLVEHNMDLVMGISRQVLVLDFGSLLAQGTPEQVQSDPEVIRAYLGGGV
ncbi:MAG: ABC transporter ATP-binding protein [Magnetococcus sp. WYHC-3]